MLHDGPPYANGEVHVGHALNKILKDLILRWEGQKGRKVQYRPGWDCHGLPIELKALQQAKSVQPREKRLAAVEDAPKQAAAVAAGIGLTAGQIRQRARALATETIEKQKSSFREWGVMGSWDSPYKTMDLDFEVRQLGVFREMVKKGLISRHRRPVYWSPSSRTALAEAELEYDEAHRCTAAFVKMPFVKLPKILEADRRIERKSLSALIWTTTPWTLPANKAIAVNHECKYCIVNLEGHGQVIVAEDRVDHVKSFLPEHTSMETVVDGIDGSELADGQAACFNLFLGERSPILSADFVTVTSGTGLVHMAPGHGMEDYQVCQKAGVGPAVAPVDDEGRYTADVFRANAAGNELLTGLDVQTDGAAEVLRILSRPAEYLAQDGFDSLVLASHPFTHKNPIDWRTKQPVIVRATAQWFADTSALEAPAISSLDSVSFIPESGKNRLSAFLAGRSQWCISRQRAWGVPIPALYHKETGEACISDESIAHIISVVQERGTDAWFGDPPDDTVWLHAGLERGAWVRGKDTMDVWFDSGTTWTSLEPREQKAISDVYVEGTDQHRGWFQSSLLTHVAVQEGHAKAPYAKLITHGFTLDAEGRKMSKSLGNVIAPHEIIGGTLLPPVKEKRQRGKSKKVAVSEGEEAQMPKYDSLGPDVLRLWVASSDYTRDVTIAVPLLQEVQNSLQKLRVTFKWLLGVLSDYSPASASSDEELAWADKAVLASLACTSRNVHQAYDDYAFHRGIKEINNFVTSDLSAFAFEVYKDRLYTGLAAERRRTQGVLVKVLDELGQMLAPVVPHLVEEVWEHSPAALKKGADHPLRKTWAKPIETEDEAGMLREIKEFSKLSATVKLAQEAARQAGKLKSGLACKVKITVSDVTGRELLGLLKQWQHSGELADLLVVSQVDVVANGEIDAASAWHFEQDGGDFKVMVLPPDGARCVRCWKFTAEEEGGPCLRCQAVLKEKAAS